MQFDSAELYVKGGTDGQRLVYHKRAVGFEATTASLEFSEVKQSVSIDWQVRENARAQIREVVKRTHRKYGYPPDMEQHATALVLQQAEVSCKDWPER